MRGGNLWRGYADFSDPVFEGVAQIPSIDSEQSLSQPRIDMPLKAQAIYDCKSKSTM